jgi:calcium-dependent protein kinase
MHLVMECLAGGELFERLVKRGCFGDSEAAGLMEQMLLAVAHMHARGVIHRDLKPENMLFEDVGSDHLKIIDFGFASRPGDNIESVSGTLDYLAPEAFDLIVSTKSDVWSLGVIAYMLLTGRSPWHTRVDMTLNMIQAGKPNFSGKHFDALSPSAKDFVKQLLSFDPAARPSAVEALQHPWIRRAVAPADRKADASMLSSCRDFAMASPLRRACCSLAAWSVDVSTQTAARQRFLELTNATGDLSLERLANLLEEAGADAAEAADICACFDNVFGERISFTCFLALVIPASELLNDERLAESFLRFDADANGLVTAADVKHVLGHCALAEAVALEVGTGICLADLECLRDAFTLKERDSDSVYETQSVGDVENNKDVEAAEIIKD